MCKLHLLKKVVELDLCSSALFIDTHRTPPQLLSCHPISLLWWILGNILFVSSWYGLRIALLLTLIRLGCLSCVMKWISGQTVTSKSINVLPLSKSIIVLPFRDRSFFTLSGGGEDRRFWGSYMVCKDLKKIWEPDGPPLENIISTQQPFNAS